LTFHNKNKHWLPTYFGYFGMLGLESSEGISLNYPPPTTTTTTQGRSENKFLVSMRKRSLPQYNNNNNNFISIFPSAIHGNLRPKLECVLKTRTPIKDYD